MARLSAASRKAPPQGQPKPQAPSSYPEDMLGSGGAYFGTAPMPHPARKAKNFGKMHAPGKKADKWRR